MGHHEVALARLPIVVSPGSFIIAPGTLSGFREGPGQVSVPVLLVPFSFSLSVAGPFAGDLPAIGGIIAYTGKAADGPGLQHDGQT